MWTVILGGCYAFALALLFYAAGFLAGRAEAEVEGTRRELRGK